MCLGCSPVRRLGVMEAASMASISGLESSRRSEMRGVVVLTVGAAGVIATALTVWAVARSPTIVDPKSVSICEA